MTILYKRTLIKLFFYHPLHYELFEPNYYDPSIVSAREEIWLPLKNLIFENGLLGTTLISDDYTVTASPTADPIPFSAELTVESIQFKGIDTTLSMSRRYQVV